MTVSAETSNVFTIESKAVSKGDTVLLGVTAQNKTGISCFQVKPVLPPELEFVGAEQESALKTGLLSFGPLGIGWFTGKQSEFTDSGKYFTMELKVADNAALGDYPVSFEVVCCNTYDLDNVQLDIVAGTVSVVTVGDIDSDEKINMLDEINVVSHVNGKTALTGKHRYAADITGDSLLDRFDVVKLIQKILGK